MVDEMKNTASRGPWLLWRPPKTGWMLVGVLALLGLTLLWFADKRAGTALEFTVHSSISGQMQVFRDEEGHFNEPMSQWYPLQAGQSQKITLEVRGPQMARIRIDPPSGGDVSLCGVRLWMAGQEHGYVVQATHQVEQASKGGCLVFSSSAEADDPQVVLAGSTALEATLPVIKRWERIYTWLLYACVFSFLLLLISLRWSFLALLRRFSRLVWLEHLDRRAHWICMGLMLLFGIFYVLRTPPGAVPDEEAHLVKVVKIREGAPLGSEKGELFPDVPQMYGPFSGYLENRQPFTEDQLRYQLSQPVICTSTKSGMSPGADPYFPHHYALATGAFAVACAADSSFGIFLYSARFLNLLLATLLVGMGVAFGGRSKWALAFIALLPMSMFELASLAADSLVIGLSIAWIGLTCGLATGHVQLRRVVPLLWVLAIAIGLLKPGAAWILASLLFCRLAFRESGMSFMRGLGCFVVLPWLLHVLLIASANPDSVIRTGVDPEANMRLLKSDPGVFLQLVWNTFSGDYGLHLYRMMVGILGWIDVPLSEWAYPVAGWALLAALFLGSNRPDAFPWRVTAPVALVMALGSVLMISLPLYARWTSLDAPIVQGLQGRYFLPTLAFLWAWVSMRSPDLIRAVLLVFVMGTAVALNLDALDRLHQAYFVLGR